MKSLLKRLGIKALIICLGVFMVLVLNGITIAESLRFRLEPNVIIIGATYNGATVRVTGEVPQGCEAVIYVVGHRRDTEFKKKGKALGLLWMNMGTVVFHDVPNLFLIFTSDQVDIKSLPIGFDVLKEEISITPEKEDKDFLFREFLKLKTKEGLYCVSKGAIKYGKNANGIKPFTCNVTFPSKLVPGDYEVHLAAINSGKVVGLKKEILKAKEKGLPSLVASLAFEHSTTYGVLATVIAIIAGLIMGTIFKGGKGGH